MQTIKNFRNVARMICLGGALALAGCNGSSKTSGSDSTKTDSSVSKPDTTKADTTKMAPADSAATPPSHIPKKDSTNAPRPLVRKT